MRAALLLLTCAVHSAEAKRPGLWLWLTNPSQLAQVVAHKDIITDISFEGYSCATNGSLTAHLNVSSSLS